MTSVALEASTRAGSVAAKSGDRCLVARLDGDAEHASDLLVRLDDLLAALDSSPDEIEAVFVGTGPGSFTGLRVAISIAMGIARGTGARARNVSSLEAMLFCALDVGEEGCALLDARAGEIYYARYRRTHDGLIAVVPACVVRAGEALSVPRDVRVFGDERGISLARLEAHGRIDLERVPTAEDVLRFGSIELARRGAIDPARIEPLYLRPFAAVKRGR